MTLNPAFLAFIHILSLTQHSVIQPKDTMPIMRPATSEPPKRAGTVSSLWVISTLRSPPRPHPNHLHPNNLLPNLHDSNPRQNPHWAGLPASRHWPRPQLPHLRP